MPVTISSHIYTFLALGVISLLLIGILSSSTIALREASEREKLRNLLQHIATEGTEIIALTAVTNSTIRISLLLPATIGNQQYWIRARNDSSRAWLEGSLGTVTENGAMFQIFLPKIASLKGLFVGGYESLLLESYLNSSSIQLSLDYGGSL